MVLIYVECLEREDNLQFLPTYSVYFSINFERTKQDRSNVKIFLRDTLFYLEMAK